MVKTLAVLLFCVGSAFAQSTTVSIIDNNGNQTTGTISNGNVFFVDNSGNTVFGTIRNGNVFLTTNKGEVTFGTVRAGNVFLTDQNGNTTGTIRNGYIFLNNSDGSTTTGTYDSNHTFTTTTPAATTPAPDTTPISPQNEQPSAQYQDGYAIGQQLGTAIGSAIQVHRIKAACKKHADDVWRFPDGSFVTCSSVNAGHPLRQWPAQARQYSPSYNPMQRSPDTQAYDLMEKLRRNLTDLAPYGDSAVMQDARASWMDMRNLYCKSAPGAAYIDLQNQQQNCPN
jgi:hypothetical protein